MLFYFQYMYFRKVKFVLFNEVRLGLCDALSSRESSECTKKSTKGHWNHLVRKRGVTPGVVGNVTSTTFTD